MDSLRERMKNYKYKGTGGNKFHAEVIETLGADAYTEFMADVVKYRIDKVRQERENGA